MPRLIALIASVAAFAGVCAVMAYIQRKNGPVAMNVVPFPEVIDNQECHFI